MATRLRVEKSAREAKVLKQGKVGKQATRVASQRVRANGKEYGMGRSISQPRGKVEEKASKVEVNPTSEKIEELVAYQ